MASVWILFLWMTGPTPTFPPTITTQEFLTRQECVSTAIAFRQAVGPRVEFMCREKLTADPHVRKALKKLKRKKP